MLYPSRPAFSHPCIFGTVLSCAGRTSTSIPPLGNLTQQPTSPSGLSHNHLLPPSHGNIARSISTNFSHALSFGTALSCETFTSNYPSRTLRNRRWSEKSTNASTIFQTANTPCPSRPVFPVREFFAGLYRAKKSHQNFPLWERDERPHQPSTISHRGNTPCPIATCFFPSVSFWHDSIVPNIHIKLFSPLSRRERGTQSNTTIHPAPSISHLSRPAFPMREIWARFYRAQISHQIPPPPLPNSAQAQRRIRERGAGG